MSVPHDSVHNGKLLADPQVLDVLRTAARTGYVLVGPHDRICRRDPDWHGYPGSPAPVVDISPAEQDHVQTLATAGLLDIDYREVVDDFGQDRAASPLHLTRTGGLALNTWTSRTNRGQR